MSWQSYEAFYLARASQPATLLGWSHPAFDDVRVRLEEEKAFIANPISVDEGVMECRRCKSKKTYSYSKQVRSSDEGFTTFIWCTECNAQWREN
jgi:DNA-directed RNA polymerase subunit M/transcription elongation factor TFIIS